MPGLPNSLSLALVALAVEAVLGYPPALFKRIGHPVTWIGAAINGLDRRLNRAYLSDGRRRALGAAGLIGVIALAAAMTLTLDIVVRGVWPGWAGTLALGFLASSLLAQMSLYRHVAQVAVSLDESLTAGREAVSHIVGRDPQSLDRAGVARAAIESLAENFSDGVVAPTFYLAAAGLTGATLYKVVNTADSMIGHRTPRHAAYGWAAARLDDLVNLPASRLSGLLIMAAAFALPGYDGMGAGRAMLRDARHHRSPNAGWPEAAMAGALDLRLAGPRRYDGVLVQDHWMGDGRPEADTTDIRRALGLYRGACLLQAAMLAALLWLSVL
jgi:adenosylcobinamide-phosphate synthase